MKRKLLLAMDESSLYQVELGVSDFVALVNQTFEFAYPTVSIHGELANYKVSKGKWIYFDLKDNTSSVRFFGTVYQVSSPLEDGMLLVVRGSPRLHPRYGFSISVSNIRPSGQGTIRRSAELLEAKLTKEGLFDEARKRPLPYPPSKIGLITSVESAAYADFIKILNARWRGITIECVDVQVQGESAPAQIIAAIELFSRDAIPPDALIIIRGGGSADDLYVFSTEAVTRAVAASRVPTMVAIGHEIDISLAELAADKRASTPSNAAELLVPDRVDVYQQLQQTASHLNEVMSGILNSNRYFIRQTQTMLEQYLENILTRSHLGLLNAAHLLEALNPRAVMQRGYAIVRLKDSKLVRRTGDIAHGDIVEIEVSDGSFKATAH